MSEMEELHRQVKGLRDEVMFSGMNFRTDAILIESTNGTMRAMQEKLEAVQASLGQASLTLAEIRHELLSGRDGADISERTAAHAERAKQLATTAETLFDKSSSNHLANAQTSLRTAGDEATESASISGRLQTGLEKAGEIVGVSKAALEQIMTHLGVAREIAEVAVGMTGQANDKTSSASAHGDTAVKEMNQYITETGGTVDMP